MTAVHLRRRDRSYWPQGGSRQIWAGLCGLVRNGTTTDDVDAVTCKRCLRLMERTGQSRP